jgi:predicted RNA binding protein YcfA (HicA-like mRNA interferase family)
MACPPVLKPHEVVRLLEAIGFVEVRQRGAHKQFRHPDGRATTVPFHKGRDISPILLRQIARDIGLTVDDLIAGGAPTPGAPPAGVPPAPSPPES